MSVHVWYSATLGVLATGDTFEALGRGLREGPSGHSLLMFGLAAVALIAAFIVIIRYSSREPRSVVEDEVDILVELLDLLELAPADRADVEFVVAHQGDACAPAALLLSPRNFALAVQQACQDAPDDARRSRLDVLCTKLFDGPLPDCAPESIVIDG